MSSDFIVGFPGETDADFQQTMNLIEEVQFDASFSFIYSARPGTPASKLHDATPLAEKKERLNIERQRDKLELTLGGIKNMSGLPDAIFIIDTNKESIAVAEANTLKIPVIAICDTNSDPSGIDYPIPGNDDALRAISLYCDLVGASILKGLESNLEQSGIDLGESSNIIEKIGARL